MDKKVFKAWIKEFGLDFEECVKDIHVFMVSLVRSGIDPASVSLEGYKYTEAIIEAYAPVLNSKRIQKEIAAPLLEEATLQIGIHTTQLMAESRSSHGLHR